MGFQSGFTILTALFLSGQAYAGEKLIWDNLDGFVGAEQCRTIESRHADFHVLLGTSLLDDKRDSDIQAVIGSLLRSRDLEPFKRDGKIFEPVRMVSAPNEAKITNRNIATRGDIGYVSRDEIGSLRDFAIKITAPVKTYNRPSISKAGSVDLVGSIWKVATGSQGVLHFVCGAKTYTVFNVSSGSSPVEQIGVSEDDTVILANMEIQQIGKSSPVATDVKPTPEKASPQASEQVPLPKPRPDIASKHAKPEKKKARVSMGEISGRICSRGDRSAIKCMVCTIQGEADHRSFNGMVEVARTILQRYSSRKYPHNICRITYQPGQFVGLRPGMYLTSDRRLLATMTAAAQRAYEEGGNGYLEFRTCSYSHIGPDYGGNCFRRTLFEDDDDLATLQDAFYTTD